MKKILRNLVELMQMEKGTVLVLVAAALTVVLGMTALVVDVGALALEKSRLQSACDAAALASARELPDTTLAQQRAYEFLVLNDVAYEEASVTFSTDHSKITVEAMRTLDYIFAPVLGLKRGTVSARSTAAFGSVSGMTGVVPFGIPDQPMTFGVEYKLKAGSHDDYGPGNYGPLALELRGASSYLNNLKNGYQGVINVGEWIDTEPGNMSGPTMDGVVYRLNQCPHSPICSIESYYSDCSKVMIVPIFDPSELAGRDQVRVVGFAAFLLKGVEGGGNESEVTGHFLEIVPPEGLRYDIDPDQVDYGLRTARLIDD